MISYCIGQNAKLTESTLRKQLGNQEELKNSRKYQIQVPTSEIKFEFIKPISSFELLTVSNKELFIILYTGVSML